MLSKATLPQISVHLQDPRLRLVREMQLGCFLLARDTWHKKGSMDWTMDWTIRPFIPNMDFLIKGWEKKNIILVFNGCTSYSILYHRAWFIFFQLGDLVYLKRWCLVLRCSDKCTVTLGFLTVCSIKEYQWIPPTIRGFQVRSHKHRQWNGYLGHQTTQDLLTRNPVSLPFRFVEWKGTKSRYFRDIPESTG